MSPSQPDPTSRSRAVRAHRSGESLLVTTAYSAEIRWLQSEGRLAHTAACLMSLTRRGFLMLSDEAPAVGTLVDVRLRWLVPNLWIQARLVGSHRLRSGPHEIRLRFRKPPPRWLFAATSATAWPLN